MAEEVEINRELNTEHLDSILKELASRKDEWVSLPLSDRIDLLCSLKRTLKEHTDEWVRVAARGKKLEANDKLVVEEWCTGPYTLATGIDALIDTLTSLKKGHTKLPSRIRTREDGQVIAKVFPHSFYDALLLNGVSAEVWMKPEVTKDNLMDHTAKLYKEDRRKGQVCLVLGAGNVTSICVMDMLYMMYAKGHVVIAKLNEVNDYMYPTLKKILKPFIDTGYVRIVCGHVDVGKYLTDHENVDCIHMTGSAKTHDAILFGVGKEGAERKAANNPRISKPITSELGGVNAVIVVPGPWSIADVEYQAEHIASAKLNNAGCNCVAAQVVVMPRTWNKSKPLLEAIRGQFRKIPERPKFYPGAEDRLQDAVSKCANAEVIKGRALITNLDAERADEYAFHHEFFTTALGQVYLDGDNAKTYLDNAVNFANDVLYGTLGVQLLIHPKTIKELGDGFENYLANLRFGAIGVNVWNGVAYLIPQCPWGAYPGHTRDDIQSGTDVVHNSFLFDKPQKSVVYAPFWETPRGLLHGSFAISPKPVYFAANKTALDTVKKLMEFVFDPRVTRLPMILASALRG